MTDKNDISRFFEVATGAPASITDDTLTENVSVPDVPHSIFVSETSLDSDSVAIPQVPARAVPAIFTPLESVQDSINNPSFEQDSFLSEVGEESPFVESLVAEPVLPDAESDNFQANTVFNQELNDFSDSQRDIAVSNDDVSSETFAEPVLPPANAEWGVDTVDMPDDDLSSAMSAEPVLPTANAEWGIDTVDMPGDDNIADLPSSPIVPQMNDGENIATEQDLETSDDVPEMVTAPTLPTAQDDLNSTDETSESQMVWPEDIFRKQKDLNAEADKIADVTEFSSDAENVAGSPVGSDLPQQTDDVSETQSVQESQEKSLFDSEETTAQNTSPAVPIQTKKAGLVNVSKEFLKELFSNGNECITAPGGSYIISDKTRAMLALFSNGRYFVVKEFQYDGLALSFVTDTKRRRLQIGQPEYISSAALSDIYEYSANLKTKTNIEVEEDVQAQARMQRDFVTIITSAAAVHVSDIHIIVADHTTVMFRANGLMHVEMEYSKEWGESFVRAAFASADISDANYAQNEYQAAQKVGKTALRGSNGRLLLPRNVQGIRMQFNPIAFGTRYVVMRLLYDEENAESAGDLSVLGFEPQEVEMFYRLRAMPTGIVVVAGPTGSGKSTTLQRNMISMLQERNYELNLITVEDPPEYPIPGARQMPVTNAATEELKDREFTKALGASLRSDPDALMVGEIRTLSAADLAFRGALSGHNVWTTLHANSAPAILTRLKDMGVEDYKLQDPSIMKGMLSQRLFRKICPHCRILAKDRLDHPAVQRLRQIYGDVGLEQAYLRGSGCKECDFRGVKGRTVVGEFLLPDATFLNLMMKGETKKALDYWVTELGGRTLKESAQARMLKGIVDIEEVERWTGLFNEID